MKDNNKISSKKIALTGVFAAVFVLLSILSVGTNDFKVSIESLAILVGSVCFGPVAGLLIGGVGEFIHQLLFYGIDITTPIWLIPYVAEGVVAGLIIKGRGNVITRKKMIFAIIAGELTLTVLITPANWASAVIQGWGNWMVIAATIPLRLVIMAIRIVIYIIILPPIARPILKSIGMSV